MATAGEILVCEKGETVVAVIKSGGNPEITCCNEAMTKKEI